MRGLMQETPLLISSLLEYAARYHGDTEIISRTVEGPLHRYTYRQLERRTKQLAHALRALGVQPGDRIATLAWNTYRHLELYYAVSGIGAVLHTVNPRLFPEQLTYIINHAEARLLFCDLTFVPLVQRLLPGLKTLQGVILLSDSDHTAQTQPGQAHSAWRSYEELIAAQPDELIWPQLDENTASSLCYTSGTTGNPKGVLYSHRSTVLHSFAVCAADGVGLSGRDCALVIVPMFHANAWGIPYAAAMCGAKLVLPGAALDGASVCQLLNDERCTLSMGVPTVWLNFFSYLDQHPERTPRALRRVLIGGSAAPRSLIERLEKQLDVRVLHLWGMTETSPLGTANSVPHKHTDLPSAQRLDLQCKQGHGFFGVEMRIVNDRGERVAEDGMSCGVLQVRGPWVARGYFKGEGGDILDAEGWFSTGDVATLDSDGYMQITDRSKDVIKSGGEWISSIDLENAALGHPAVHEAAVIGLPHPVWQERPLLVVVCKPGAAVSCTELREFLGQRVAKWWLPDDVVFVNELPHTATGKLHKLTLREQFKDHKLPTST